VIALELNPIGVTLWGDPKQLQPFSNNTEVYASGYTMSLLRRVQYIAEEEGVSEIPHRLVTQHRMAPELAELPETVFYPDRLWNGELLTETPDLSGSNLANLGNPLTFVNAVETFEVRGNDGLSFSNVKETVVAAQFVDRLCVRGVDRFMARKSHLQRECCRRFVGRLRNGSFLTVDGSEGSDFEIVILLCVRTNQSGN
jgi:superfamily I DNA and/or RNA helicase